jgi:hypothetical protein
MKSKPRKGIAEQTSAHSTPRKEKQSEVIAEARARQSESTAKRLKKRLSFLFNHLKKTVFLIWRLLKILQ